MVRTGPVSVHEWFKLLFRACDWLRSEPWHVAFSLSGLPNLGLELHRDLAKLFPGGRVTFCQPERLSPAELGCSYPKITSFSTSSGSEPQRASCHCSTDLCTATCRPLLACKKRVAALVGFWWRSTEEALPGILENLGAGVGGSDTQAVALRKLHAVGCRVAPPLRGAGRGRLLFAVWVETKDVTRLHL